MIRGGYIFALIWSATGILLLLFIVLYQWRNGKFKLRNNWLAVLFFTFIVSAILYINIASSFHRRYLRNLKVDEIASIQIGEREITERQTIEQITDSFSMIEAWTSERSPLPKTPFIIELKTGEISEYRLMYWKSKQHQNGEYIDGIVIDFYKQVGNGRFNHGGAFSAETLSVFRELEIEFTD